MKLNWHFLKCQKIVSVKQVVPGALVSRQGTKERLMECDAVYYPTVFTLSPLISFDNFPSQVMSSPAQTHPSLGWQWLTIYLQVGKGI